MKTFNAREMLSIPKKDLWEAANGSPITKKIKVVFDDGELTTNYQQTIFSVYCWGLLNKYPKTPISIRHHLNGMMIKSNTHTELMNRVLWDCYDQYKGRIDMELAWEIIYRDTNIFYNDFTYGCEAHVQSMNVFDFIEIADDPDIQSIIQSTKATAHSIDSHCYPKARKVISDSIRFQNNAITRSTRNESLSMGQALQCLVMRGAVTDTDSNIFPKPIMSNFTYGLNTLHDSLVESRSAAKSLTFNDKHLSDVEYFNRKLQLMSSTILRLHRGDCGSTQYLPWFVNAKDLSKIVGIYYLDEESGKLKVIREKDSHLIGKVILMRSVLYCAHTDTQGVCSTCLGEISHSIPDGTSPGDFAARCLSEESAQTVLSTKHLNANAIATELELSAYEREFLVATEDNHMMLNPNLAKLKPKLIVKADEAKGFGFFNDSKHFKIELLQASRISSLSEVVFLTTKGNETERNYLSVSNGSLRSSLSHDMLEYVFTHKWSLDNKNNFIIDLKDWDYNKFAFNLPMRSQNMMDIVKSIEGFLSKASGKKLGTNEDDEIVYKSLSSIDSIPVAIKQFYELVTASLSLNLPHLSLILKAAMVRSSEHNDYRIPHLGNRVEFGHLHMLMENRSAAAAMAFERHRQMLTTPASYLVEHRPDSIYDALLR